MGENLIGREGGIVAFRQRSEGDAAEHPICSQRVLHHGLERDIRVGEESDASLEFRMLPQFAWMRRVRGKGGECVFEPDAIAPQ